MKISRFRKASNIGLDSFLASHGPHCLMTLLLVACSYLPVHMEMCHLSKCISSKDMATHYTILFLPPCHAECYKHSRSSVKNFWMLITDFRTSSKLTLLRCSIKGNLTQDLQDRLVRASHSVTFGSVIEDHLKSSGRLPWWLSGEETACQCRRHGFDPWDGKIPHASEQQNSCAATREPVLWSPAAVTIEPSHHDSWSPRALELIL